MYVHKIYAKIVITVWCTYGSRIIYVISDPQGRRSKRLSPGWVWYSRYPQCCLDRGVNGTACILFQTLESGHESYAY